MIATDRMIATDSPWRNEPLGASLLASTIGILTTFCEVRPRLFRLHAAKRPSDGGRWIDGGATDTLRGELTINSKNPAFTTAGSRFADLVHESGNPRPTNADSRIGDRSHDLLERGAGFDVRQLECLLVASVDNLDGDRANGGGRLCRYRFFDRWRVSRRPATADGQADEQTKRKPGQSLAL